MPGTGAVVGRVAAFGAQSLYVGSLTPEFLAALPRPTFGSVMHKARAELGALAIGLRAPNGKSQINPPHERPVRPDDQLLYLAEKAVLPQRVGDE